MCVSLCISLRVDFSHLLPRSARASMLGTGESAGRSVGKFAWG